MTWSVDCDTSLFIWWIVNVVIFQNPTSKWLVYLVLRVRAMSFTARQYLQQDPPEADPRALFRPGLYFSFPAPSMFQNFHAACQFRLCISAFIMYFTGGYRFLFHMPNLPVYQRASLLSSSFYFMIHTSIFCPPKVTIVHGFYMVDGSWTFIFTGLHEPWEHKLLQSQ